MPALGIIFNPSLHPSGDDGASVGGGGGASRGGGSEGGDGGASDHGGASGDEGASGYGASGDEGASGDGSGANGDGDGGGDDDDPRATIGLESGSPQVLGSPQVPSHLGIPLHPVRCAVSCHHLRQVHPPQAPVQRFRLWRTRKISRRCFRAQESVRLVCHSPQMH